MMTMFNYNRKDADFNEIIDECLALLSENIEGQSADYKERNKILNAAIAKYAVIAFGKLDELCDTQFEQLVIEGLGDVVVGTEFKALYAIFLGALGGQQNYRNVRPADVGLDATA